MKIKKLITIFTCFILIFSLSSCTNNANKNAQKEDPINTFIKKNNYSSFFVKEDNTIYAIFENSIDVFDERCKLIKTISLENIPLSESLEYSTFLTNKLLINNDTFFVIRENKTYTFNDKGEKLNEFESPYNVFDAKLSRDKLYILSGDDMYNIYVLDEENQKYNLIENTQDTKYLSNMSNKNLSAWIFENSKISGIEIDTKKDDVVKTNIDVKNTIASFVYDDKKYIQKEDGIYLNEKNEDIFLIGNSEIDLNSFQVLNGKVYSILAHSEGGTYFKIVTLKNIDTNMKKLIIYYPKTGTGRINIEYCQEKFSKNHPDVKVQIEEFDRNSYLDKIKPEILSKSKDFDLFFVPSSEIRNIEQSGVLLDLYKSDIIMEKVKKNINPKFLNTSTINKKFIGVPIYGQSYEPFSINLDFAKLNNIPIPSSTWNYDDYLSFKNTLIQKGLWQTNYSYYEQDYIESVLYSGIDFNNKSVNVDKNALIKALENSKLNYELDMKNETYENDVNKDGSTNDKILYSYLDSLRFNGNKKILNEIHFNNSSALHAKNFSYLCINNQSRNLKLAEELISYMYDEEFVLDRMEFAAPAYIDIYKYNDVYTKFGLQSDFVTKEYKSAYDYYLDNLVISYGFTGMFSSKEMDDFWSGKITASECSDLLIENLKLMIME